MMQVRSSIHLLTGVLLFLTVAGCKETNGNPAAEGKSGAPDTLVDRPIEPYRAELVDVAFQAASEMPVHPFIKDRSRWQEKVVGVCLELDQPKLALKYADRIKNWRRGAAYADIAYHLAKHGMKEDLAVYLERAEQIANAVNLEQWRSDRIKIKVARVHTLRGQMLRAEEIEKGIQEGGETGKLASERAAADGERSFEQAVKELDALVASGQFDQIRNAQLGYIALYDRHYGERERRDTVEQKARDSWHKMAVSIKIDLLLSLAHCSIAHEDHAKALGLIDEAQGLKDGAEWMLLDRIPVTARLAEARFGAGDKARAVSDAEVALASFKSDHEKIRNFERADALIPLAEAFAAMGESTEALATYRLAVEQGTINPNARTRAEDLAANCLSMAVHGVEPDAELWALIRQIREGLVAPW